MQEQQRSIPYSERTAKEGGESEQERIAARNPIPESSQQEMSIGNEEVEEFERLQPKSENQRKTSNTQRRTQNRKKKKACRNGKNSEKYRWESEMTLTHYPAKTKEGGGEHPKQQFRDPITRHKAKKARNPQQLKQDH